MQRSPHFILLIQSEFVECGVGVPSSVACEHLVTVVVGLTQGSLVLGHTGSEQADGCLLMAHSAVGFQRDAKPQLKERCFRFGQLNNTPLHSVLSNLDFRENLNL